MIYKTKKILSLIFIFLILIISSKIIVNNNFQVIKNNKHESFFLFYKKLSENYKMQRNNIQKEDLCQNIQERKLDRHHLRWVFEGSRILFLDSIYSKFESKKILNYFFSFSIFLILLITFIFSIMTSFVISNKKLIDLKANNLLITFFIYIFFISIYSFREVSELRFSFYEMLFLSAGIYFAVKKYLLFYLITCILAILNRESGIICVLLWFIFNSKFLDRRQIFSKVNINSFLTSFFTLIITLSFFIFANKEIFNCGFQPQLFMHIDVENTRVLDQNLFSLTMINSFIVNFLLVFFFVVFYWYEDKYQLKILILVSIYSLIFLFFTPIDHFILRIIFSPLIVIYVSNYLLNFNLSKKSV